MGNPLKKVGRWIDKTVTQPVFKEAKKFDPSTAEGWKNIGLNIAGPFGYGVPWIADVLGSAAARKLTPDMPEMPNPDLLAGIDPFEIMLREAALNTIRTKQRGDRAASFYTGPRGLEGPAKTVLG